LGGTQLRFSFIVIVSCAGVAGCVDQPAATLPSDLHALESRAITRADARAILALPAVRNALVRNVRGVRITQDMLVRISSFEAGKGLEPGVISDTFDGSATLDGPFHLPVSLSDIATKKGADRPIDGTANFHNSPVVQAKGDPLFRPMFQPQKFVQLLNAALVNPGAMFLTKSAAGYAMQLRRNGMELASTADGFAEYPVEGCVPWSIDQKQNVASLSKYFTALALRRLLDQHGVSIDTSIESYLPQYWSKGPGINAISFRYLLQHKSGFNTGGDEPGKAPTFAVMKEQIANGPASMPGTVSRYENLNFALMRFLIAVLNGNVDLSFNPPVFGDYLWNAAAIDAYVNYVNANVFAPAGVGPASLQRPDDAALAYTSLGVSSSWPCGTDVPAKTKGWVSDSDMSPWAGTSGWHLSAREVAKVADAARQGKIVAQPLAQEMLEEKLGLDSPEGGVPALSLDGFDRDASGPVLLPSPLYYKRGVWGFDPDPSSCGPGCANDGNETRHNSLLWFLPDDMELVVLLNSDAGNPPYDDIGALVQKAYMNSFEPSIVP